jgi:ABC-type sugar transport system permease subunit
MTGWTMYFALGVVDVALLGGLVIATLYLRRKHPGHVFTIWYAFWLMLTLFSGLFYYVWANEQAIPGSILSGSSFLGGFIVWFQHTSMDFRDERYLIASIDRAIRIEACRSAATLHADPAT